MERRKLRHIRATIYLVIANICMLILLFGLFFNVLECSVWGSIGSIIFWLSGLCAAHDDRNVENYSGLFADDFGGCDDCDT